MSLLLQIPELLSHEESQALIDRLETIGFDDQSSSDGARHLRKRCMFEDRELAAQLWERIESHVVPLNEVYGDDLRPNLESQFSLASYRPSGLNERFRCYQYRPGEQFRRHVDFAHEWNERRRTFYTVLVYLNDDYEGGETRFEDDCVTPRTGLVAIFPHELFHESVPIQSGTKYALRTDVVFVAEAIE